MRLRIAFLAAVIFPERGNPQACRLGLNYRTFALTH
jgi:hypothetical protein